MTIYDFNLNECVLRCKDRHQADHQLLCNHNQQPIQANAEANKCPAGRFREPTAPLAEPKPKPPMKSRVSRGGRCGSC